MKLDNRYEVQIVIIERNDGDVLGDVYACSFEEYKREHPFSGYAFGFIVVDTLTGFIPDGCNDWNDTVEEAIFDYRDNVQRVTDFN